LRRFNVRAGFQSPAPLTHHVGMFDRGRLAPRAAPALPDPSQLRGDDVAELQVRLAQFGFNPGRIDGIFGVLTEEALNEFQRNCALEVSAP